MGIPIIQIIMITGITLMATFRFIMILMAFIISTMGATLIITLVAILVGVTVGEVALDRQAQGRASSALPWNAGSGLLRRRMKRKLEKILSLPIRDEKKMLILSL